MFKVLINALGDKKAFGLTKVIMNVNEVQVR